MILHYITYYIIYCYRDRAAPVPSALPTLASLASRRGQDKMVFVKPKVSQMPHLLPRMPSCLKLPRKLILREVAALLR